MVSLSLTISEPQDWADDEILTLTEPFHLTKKRMKNAISFGETQLDIDAYKWQVNLFQYYDSVLHPVKSALMKGLEETYLPWLKTRAFIDDDVYIHGDELKSILKKLKEFGEGYGTKENERVNKVFADKSKKELIPMLEDMLEKSDNYFSTIEKLLPKALRSYFEHHEYLQQLTKLFKNYGPRDGKIISSLTYEALLKRKGQEGAESWKLNLSVTMKQLFRKFPDPIYEREYLNALKKIHGLTATELQEILENTKGGSNRNKVGNRINYSIKTLGRTLSSTPKELVRSFSINGQISQQGSTGKSGISPINLFPGANTSEKSIEYTDDRELTGKASTSRFNLMNTLRRRKN